MMAKQGPLLNGAIDQVVELNPLYAVLQRLMRSCTRAGSLRANRSS